MLAPALDRYLAKQTFIPSPTTHNQNTDIIPSNPQAIQISLPSSVQPVPATNTNNELTNTMDSAGFSRNVLNQNSRVGTGRDCATVTRSGRVVKPVNRLIDEIG